MKIMKKQLLVVAGLLAIATLAGCGMKNTPSSVDDTGTNQPVTTGTTSTSDINQEVQDPLTNISSGANEYTLFFNGDTTQETIRVKHTAREATKLYFINADAKKMHVVVKFPNNDSGNLRLSQIIMPDGQMDGPFGMDTTYDLEQNGGYQLIFNENMMAGDPWGGEAVITVSLSK